MSIISKNLNNQFMQEPWYLAYREKYRPYRRGKTRCLRCGRRLDWHPDIFDHPGNRDLTLTARNCLKEEYYKKYLKTIIARWSMELWNAGKGVSFFDHFVGKEKINVNQNHSVN